VILFTLYYFIWYNLFNIMNIDLVNKHLYRAAYQFDRTYDLTIYDVETAHLISKIMNASCQSPEGETWPDGLREAFSHYSEVVYRKTGAVEWLRNLPRPWQSPLDLFEAEASRILDKIQIHTAHSVKEDVGRDIFSSLSYFIGFKERFPQSYRLFEEIYCHNNLEMDDTCQAQLNQVVWQHFPKTHWLKFKFCHLTAKVYSAAHSLLSQKWIRWSVSVILSGLIVFPIGLTLYPFYGLCLILALQVYLIVVHHVVLPVSFDLALGSCLLAPVVLVAFVGLHVLLTLTVFSTDRALGGRISLVHRSCSYLQQMGFSTNGCLLSFCMATLPFTCAAFLTIEVNNLVKDAFLQKIAQHRTVVEVKCCVTTFACHMLSAAFFVDEIEKREIEKRENLETSLSTIKSSHTA